MRWSTALVIVFLLVPPSASGETRVTRFPRRAPGDIVVPVTIGGQGPFRMLLDTGASRTSVTGAVADRLASRTVGVTEMVTPAGRGSRALVLLKGVTVGAIGPQSVVGMRLEVGDLGDPDIDGLVGLDLVSRAAFTIDYAAGTIEWRRAGDAEPSGVHIPLDAKDGRLVALATAGDRQWRFIVDSGADRLVVFNRAGVRLPAARLAGAGSLRSLAGLRTMAVVLLDRLVIGGLAMDGLDAGVVGGSDVHPALEDGLLPLHVFDRVTVDAPGRALIVQILPASRSR